MFAVKPDLERCAAGRYAGLYVRIEVSGKDGRVRRAAVGRTESNNDDRRPDKETEQCVASALSRAQFTPFKLEVFKIGFPYRF
jgi:hypothetical protein